MVEENAPQRMLVEGPDDKHSVIHLLRRHGIDWDSEDERVPWVKECNGVDTLLNSVPVSVKSYARLGIVIDANADIKARWGQVQEKLASASLSLPTSPDASGTIIQGIFPDWKVGVWLMPDNTTQGKLEDLLCTLVPSTDPCWKYAQKATKHARKIGAEFPEEKTLKARLHTWLSWREEPGLPFGTAIKAAYFSHDSPEALKFVSWFNRLYFDDG